MEDSFFGFDTSIPIEDDGGGRIAEPSEEEYDALNDETFGSAINGDWEEVHENLVRLRDNLLINDNEEEFLASDARAISSDFILKDQHNSFYSKITDSEFKFNLLKLEPSKSDFSFKDINPSGRSQTIGDARASVPANLLMSKDQNETGTLTNFIRNSSDVHGLSTDPKYARNNQEKEEKAPKLCTLEDIERNLIIQQSKGDQKQTNRQHAHPFPPNIVQGSASEDYIHRPSMNSSLTSNFIPSNSRVNHPPGFNFHPHNIAVQQQGHHFPAHVLLNQQGHSNNFSLNSNTRGMPNSIIPVAINNYAMHPNNFNVMRTASILHPPNLMPQSQSPRLPSAHLLNNTPISNANYHQQINNLFNTRLVQEIQQNHPLLQNVIRQSIPQNYQDGNIQVQHCHHQQYQQQRSPATKHNANHFLRRDINGSSSGNFPFEEFDDYANLMSTRDKHWLIGIQLSQLNTDTPFIDDYYYTVYRERKAAHNGSLRHSQAHKDNQLNHPLTQPRGHAQLVLVQLGNKNGVRNGQHRESRNMENGKGTGDAYSNTCMNVGHDQRTPYVFAPLKFENSLGKLQYGSVTAPRKIIDAEIVSGDLGIAFGNKDSKMLNGNLVKGGNASTLLSTQLSGDTVCNMVQTTQRKSLYVLLHIESLYRIVLKFEDLSNPKAIATIVIKKKKEDERVALLEQIENSNKDSEDKNMTSNPSNLRNKFVYEIEEKCTLISKLNAGLTNDNIVAMMNVRKGKTLIRRILLHIGDQEIRWNVWIGIFSSLQSVLKKDPEDSDGTLCALLSIFKTHIQLASFEIITKLSTSLPITERKAENMFCNKFFMSILLCLITRAEEIYTSCCDYTLDDFNKDVWSKFLDQIVSFLNKTMQKHFILFAIESDSIQPLIDHFQRFKQPGLELLVSLSKEILKH